MARIRSVHPGQWTDDEFVQMSPLARLLAIALRNEADDHGIFEWKPITIKMRLLPADNCKIGDLLAELVGARQIIPYEIGQAGYGWIRNFGRYQRPKKPKYLYPIPAWWTEAHASSADSSEPDEDEQRSGSAKGGTPAAEEGGRREDEGGRMKGKEGDAPDDAALVVQAWNEICHPLGLGEVQKLTETRRRSIAARLRDAGGVDGLRVAFAKVAASPVLRGERNGKGHEGWRADFDFVLQERNFVKLMEGKYDDRESPEAPLFRAGARTGFATAAAELERRLEERDRRQPQPGPDG